ncbi:MAG TPA: hypothetical protein VFO40_01680 [Chthoniobacterales bacterium]|nr:hypothetical protein [Chthoniobacterales bacterium]
MSIRFRHRGKEWEADTPEEAVRLRELLAHKEYEDAQDYPEQEDWLIRSETVWTPDVLWAFVQNLGPQTAAAVKIILNAETISSGDLVKRLQVENEMALAGILSGISKQLKKLELRPTDLYTVSTVWAGKVRHRSFQITRGFALAAQEVGWHEEKEENAAATKRKHK